MPRSEYTASLDSISRSGLDNLCGEPSKGRALRVSGPFSWWLDLALSVGPGADSVKISLIPSC